MTATKKISSIIMIFILTFCALFSFPTTASAATSSYGTRTCTLTVTTKANWLKPGGESITLKQTKGTYQKRNVWGKLKNAERYGTWRIKGSSTDGTHKIDKTLSGSSVKISLKRNKTYRLTITWDSTSADLGTNFRGYTKFPTWRVSKTNKVSSYY